MKRNKIKEMLVKHYIKEIAEKGEDYVCVKATCIGKNSWTNKEFLDAIMEDKDLENYGNPIDEVIDYLEYCKEHGIESKICKVD